MIQRKINNEEGQGFTRVFQDDNFENVNPIDHYSKIQIQVQANLLKDLIKIEDPELVKNLDNEFFIKKATELWLPQLEKAIKRDIPENYLSLLSSNSKNEQEKLLKGQNITPDQLFTFILKAFTDFGYTHSKYRSDHLQTGLEESDLPTLMRKDGDKIKKVGETKLTDGQLKQVFEQRKVIIANFLDKGDSWHCIFVTYRSLEGKETWKDGQPHFHYISDKWGLSRQEVVEKTKSGKYPATSVHIGLNEYR